MPLSPRTGVKVVNLTCSSVILVVNINFLLKLSKEEFDVLVHMSYSDSFSLSISHLSCS